MTITPFRFRHCRLRVISPPIVLHDHVDALAAGQVEDPLGEILPAVVDEVVRAQRLGALELLVAARGGEIMAPASFATWTAALPMPEPAAWMRTLCPPAARPG